MEGLTEEQKKLLAETAYNLGRAISEFVKTFERAIENAIENALKPMEQMMQELSDIFEPYQKFEMMHPRKKPRGSIRRYKRKMRGERRK